MKKIQRVAAVSTVLGVLLAGANAFAQTPAGTSNFSSGMDGWTFWSDIHPGETHSYTVVQDTADGSVASPCARISGEYNLNTLIGGTKHAHNFGTQKNITVTGSSATVSLKFKVTSWWPLGTVTNGFITVLSSTGTVLHQGTLKNGGWSTGWLSHTTPAFAVAGGTITVRAYLQDAWENNWSQTLKIDDVSVAFTGTAPSPGPGPTPTTGIPATVSLQQWQVATQTQITEGGSIPTRKARLSINATISTGTLAAVEFELRPIATSFTNAATHQAALSGTSAVGFVDVELANGSYRWQARVKNGAGQYSSWTQFGTGGNTDFIVNVPSGTAPAPTAPAPSNGLTKVSNGGGDSRCGLLGVEALIALLATGLLRRRAN